MEVRKIMKYNLVVVEPNKDDHIKSRAGKWFINLTSENKETQDASGFGHLSKYVVDIGEGILAALNQVKWPAVIGMKRYGK